MTHYATYTEADYDFLIATYATLSAHEQAQALGRTYGAVKFQRKMLARAGKVERAHAAGNRLWTSDELATLEELVQSGRSLTSIARQLKRPRTAIQQKLRRSKKSIRAMRKGTFAVRTMAEVAALFGVSESAVLGWIRRDWLYCRRNGTRTKRKDKWGAHRLITDEHILAFIERRDSWPVWEVERITDPDWREVAADARRSAGGRWLTCQEAAALLHYAYQTIIYWLVKLDWQVEWVHIGRRRYIWLADGTTLTPPPGAR